MTRVWCWLLLRQGGLVVVMDRIGELAAAGLDLVLRNSCCLRAAGSRFVAAVEDPEMREEISPKKLLLIGPTG